MFAPGFYEDGIVSSLAIFYATKPPRVQNNPNSTRNFVFAMSYNLLLENLVQDVGGCGLYQTILASIVHFGKVVCVFSMLTMTFAGQDPGFWCRDASGLIISNSSLEEVCELNTTRDCDKFVFDKSMRTIVSEWNLVCDKKWAVAMVTTVQMTGVLIGSFVAGHIADHLGRKPTFFMSFLLMIIFNVVGYFSVSWVMYAVVRCLIGVGMGFYLTVQHNITIEMTSSKWRPVIIATPSWALGSSLFGLLAYIFKDWQNIHLAIGCLGLPFLLTWWFVPESFRWLVTKERFKDADRTVHNIARMNRRVTPDLSVIFKVAREVNEEKKTARKYSVIDMFKTKESTKYTMALLFAWFAVGFAYYGITFGVKSLSGNLYMNIFLMNIVEAPCMLSVSFLVQWFGRKKVALAFLLISAAAGTTVGVLQHIGQLSSERAKVSCSCGWQVLIIVSTEIYPTVVRTIAFGVHCTSARVGAMVAPQIVFLADYVPGLLYFVSGILMVFTAGVVMICKETKGLVLKDMLVGGTDTTDLEADKSRGQLQIVNIQDKQ